MGWRVMERRFPAPSSTSPPGSPRLPAVVPGPALPAGLFTALPVAWTWLASGQRAAHSRRAGRGGARVPAGARSPGPATGGGRPRRGALHPLSVMPFLHPHFERGRDRFCLKEIAAQQVRTRLGSGMWKYDSEQLPQLARLAGRPPAGPRQGERGERGPGPGPRAPGGRGAGPGPSPRRPGRPHGPSRASRTSCQGNFNTSG